MTIPSPFPCHPIKDIPSFAPPRDQYNKFYHSEDETLRNPRCFMHPHPSFSSGDGCLITLFDFIRLYPWLIKGFSAHLPAAVNPS
jgi:hypothetical protein